jgi:hypothetical protein
MRWSEDLVSSLESGDCVSYKDRERVSANPSWCVEAEPLDLASDVGVSG